MDNTHSLMLENRQGGRITGVKDVKSFDEKEILLFTQAGKLVIKGEQLHVKQLDLEKGEVDLEGKVDSFAYTTKGAGCAEERRSFDSGVLPFARLSLVAKGIGELL